MGEREKEREWGRKRKKGASQVLRNRLDLIAQITSQPDYSKMRLGQRKSRWKML